jgi:hypothetical protein
VAKERSIIMTRVFGLHEIELHPGVKEEDFENFVLNEMSTAPMYPGWSMRLLKGERGERKGKYLLLIDIESLEARDRFAPAPDKGSEETAQFDQEHKDEVEPLFQKWNTFSPTQIGQNSNYTDYLVLEK